MKKILIVLILLCYSAIGISQSLLPRKNPLTEKWGYVNKKDKWVITPTYDKAQPFEKKGKYAVVMLDGKYGCIDRKGNLSIKPVFRDYNMMVHALQELENNKKIGSVMYPIKGDGINNWGFVNHVGDWIVEPLYEEVGEFGLNTFVAVKYQNKWGCINKKGELVINPVFAQRQIAEKAGLEYQDGVKKGKTLYPLKDNTSGKWGYSDYTGNWVLKPNYDQVVEFSGDNAYVVVKGKWGMISRKGKFIIEPVFDKKAIVRAGMEYQNGIKKGTTLYPIFDEFKSLWGFVDYTGDEIIEFRFQDIKDIYNDKYTLVKVQDKWGCIDKKGEFLIQPVFHDPIVAGAAMVELDNKTKKNKILYVELDDAMKKYGYVNYYGEWVIDPIFDQANPFEGKEALVMYLGQKRLINRKGKFIDGINTPALEFTPEPEEEPETIVPAEIVADTVVGTEPNVITEPNPVEEETEEETIIIPETETTPNTIPFEEKETQTDNESLNPTTPALETLTNDSISTPINNEPDIDELLNDIIGD